MPPVSWVAGLWRREADGGAGSPSEAFFPPRPPPPASLGERRFGDSGRRRDKRPSDGWPRRALPETGTRWLSAERGTGHASANVAVPGREERG